MMDRRSQLNRTNIRLALIGVALLAATITLTSCSSKVEVWVEAGESIQAAIDRAEPGTVILLTGQVGHPWRENLIIDKSITLRGQGDRSVIEGGTSAGLGAAILIESTERIVVELEGITVKGGDILIVQISGSAKATLTNCIVSEPGDRFGTGIEIRDFAQASISDCTVSKSFRGIVFGNSTLVTINNSLISQNEMSGIVLDGFAQVTITNSTIKDSVYGIGLSDSTQATLVNNTISENERYSISLYQKREDIEGVDMSGFPDTFAGYVTGKKNTFSGVGILSDGLEFLRTSEGGELDRRGD